MNKKEISEIRKTLTPEHAVITRICCCYVDGEKEIKFTSNEAFHLISEGEAFKYFDIFKHTLSGTLGKNLINMEFPLDEETEGGKQDVLRKLRDSKLEDDSLLEEFYQSVIANYDAVSNYYIILIHAVYDVPGKSSDGSELFDASDSVYDYLLCSICPVKLSKSGLSYAEENNCMNERVRDWIVSTPANGFLFPAFNERESDIHSLLYFSKNPETLQIEFIENMFGSLPPMTASNQKEIFNHVIVNALGAECDFDTIKTIYENINEMIEESRDNPEPLILTKEDVIYILEESSVSGEGIERFEKQLEETVGEKPAFIASNITNIRQFYIETSDVVIKVNPERTDLIETRMIDGRKCLVITVNDHIEVNGICIKE